MGRVRTALAGRDGGAVRRVRHRLRPAPRALSGPVALAGWLLFVAACWLAGTLLLDRGVETMLYAPPFYGRWDVRLPVATAVPVLLAAVLIAAGPAAARRLPWRRLLLVTAAAALAWGLALTVLDGPQEIEKPLRIKTQYIHAVDQVGTPGAFLSTFTERVDDYPAHVRAHPPAMVLGLWGLDRLGLGGTWWAAAAILLLAATTAPAVLLTVRALSDGATARRVAPFLALTPAALSVTTTADGAYMAVGAWAVCATVLALVRRSAGLAALGGVLFGILAFCSYGLVLLGAVPLAVALDRRRARELVVAAAGALAVVALVAAAGFWWLDGLHTTRREYAQSVASTRPYAYFVFNNLAAFSVWLGPAVVLALAARGDRRLRPLVAGGLVAVAVANLTGLSKAEVERIWLPFLPWVVVAVAALPLRRRLLAAQAGTALAVAIGVNTLW